ncbi:MAG: GNAT family N-acetyltransferase [Verrucomicrobiales bacterium]|nr:GNAT family N-acetyltransferase [Verrucomicrobiales bacterium]
MEISLRTATSADADSVARIYLGSRKTFLDYAQLAHSDAEVTVWITEILIPGGNVTVAENGPAVVGMMATSTNKNASWIDQLYVVPDFVGKGVGSRLIEFAKKNLPCPIRLFTFQQNEGSRRFYTRHGFRLVSETDGKGNEERCPDALYEFSQEQYITK